MRTAKQGVDKAILIEGWAEPGKPNMTNPNQYVGVRPSPQPTGLMGMGGVLGMGCTIGQGISGVSTLSLGSILTVISIIAGSAVTMKYQYYLIKQEDN